MYVFFSCQVYVLIKTLINFKSIILLTFFAPFVAFQFPASILVRKIGPRYFLASIVFAWGIVVLVRIR